MLTFFEFFGTFVYGAGFGVSIMGFRAARKTRPLLRALLWPATLSLEARKPRNVR